MQSFTLYLESVAHTGDHAIALGKALSACLMIRGAQLAVVRRLESKYVVNIHTTSLNWVGKRLAAYENAKNKSGISKSLTFFKVLVPLSSTLDSRDSMKM